MFVIKIKRFPLFDMKQHLGLNIRYNFYNKDSILVTYCNIMLQNSAFTKIRAGYDIEYIV